MQSLKLDTSVWSNEIVQVRGQKGEKVGEGDREQSQKKPLAPAWGRDWNVRGLLSSCPLPLPLVTLQLFIVLGNDRANRFWAGALPAGEGLHPDSTPGSRGEFISRKYRLGLFRKPHPQHPDHSQLLQVGGKAGGEQGLGRAVSALKGPDLEGGRVR